MGQASSKRRAGSFYLEGKANVGELDRLGRGVLAVILVARAGRHGAVGRFVATAMATALGAAALTGRSVLNEMAGLDTSDTCTMANLKSRLS